MTAEEFDKWRDGSVRAYALGRSRAIGTPIEIELERAAEGFKTFFPDGVHTAGIKVLVTLDAAGERTGVLWLGPHPSEPDAWWVWDIEIDEARQGQGHGRAAMLAAEAAVVAAGGTELGLNVFGSNERARALYESLGYRTVTVEMAKTIAP